MHTCRAPSAGWPTPCRCCASWASRRWPASRAGVASSSRSRLPSVRRYHVTTFGCQMNAHDSERIKGLLEESGLGEAASPDDADVVVFNTCTIREKADDRFVAHLHNAR